MVSSMKGKLAAAGQRDLPLLAGAAGRDLQPARHHAAVAGGRAPADALRVEHADLVPEPAQGQGRGQPGIAAADHGHADAVGEGRVMLRRLGGLPPPGPGLEAGGEERMRHQVEVPTGRAGKRREGRGHAGLRTPRRLSSRCPPSRR